jgi:hypothetical protein
MAKSTDQGEAADRTIELQLTGSDVSVAGEHLARGRAHMRGGSAAMAQAEFQAALALDPDSDATGELAKLRWPGRGYLVWLQHLQAALSPKTYLEIGVEQGHSLATARPIGIDPRPRLSTKLVAETEIFTETSDEFFAQRRLNSLLDGKSLDLVFIDGLHLFEQVLKDFTNVEKHCGNSSREKCFAQRADSAKSISQPALEFA